ncbi:MAG: TIGR01777 family oxidoreductase [Nitrosomonas sp.]|jgi:uncharacterized protein (TIGR01777 family)|nr:TIGR01777 family oxidoreductase [Nitrosomonas sp.]
MKILITGGTGFIGRSLTPALLADGHSITILSRYPGKVESVFGKKTQQIGSMSDLTDQVHFDAIFNFAGAPIFGSRWSNAHKTVLLNSRIHTTQTIIDYIERAKTKPSVLLSGSAIGIYGDRGDTILDETAPLPVPTEDDFGHQLCVTWEKTAEKAKTQNIRVCLLRTGLVLGKNGGFLQPMLQPFKLGLGCKLGSGNQWMPWIHRDDYVAICKTLLENNTLAGVFNLTAPNPVTNSTFTETLARLLKRKALLTMPTWALNLLLGEMAQLLTGSQRVIPKAILDSGFQFKYTELETALADVLHT